MWPHKSGLGVRLSYGVSGNPNVEIKSSPSASAITNNELYPMVTFPRKEGQRGEDGYLNEVACKSLLKKPLNHCVGELYKSSANNISVGFDDAASASASVPYKIISSYELETKAIDSVIAYDPGFGDIVQAFKIKPQSQNELLNGLAHITGESLSVLSLSIVIQDGDSMKLSKAYEVDFLAQVRQVVVAENEDKDRLIILVRTRVKVYVTTCKLSRYSNSSKSDPSFKLSIIKEICLEKLSRSTFADVAVCPVDARKFATIDIEGNLSAWAINKNNDKVSLLSSDDLQLPITDAKNLSNWLRLTWLSNLNSIMISTRTKMFQYDFDMPVRKILITSDTWSRTRDIVCVGGMIFYLTSKELIWLRCEAKVERLLSWKHFLNDNDPSLKLSVYAKDEKYLLFIYSQVSPVVLMYTFGFENTMPCSLRDPYMLQRSNAAGLKQLIPLNMDDTSDIVFLELSASLHLQQRRLQFGPLSQHPSTIEEQFEDNDNKRKNHKHKSHHLKKLHAALVQASSTGEDEESVVAIQQYASRLGASLEGKDAQKQNNTGYRSLLEVDYRAPFGISDLSELDDMIAELEESPLTENINIKSFINNAFIQRNGFIKVAQAQTHIVDIHALLQRVFGGCNAANSITNSAILLGLSLIKFQAQTNQFESAYETAKAASHKHVRNVLNEWDAPSSSQTDHQLASQSYNASQSVPSLKSSQIEPTQPPKLSQSTSSQLGDFSKPNSKFASQQRSQSRLGDALRISSQRSSQGGSQAKRRKKKGGF
ncbi:hypothetical protein KGF57_002498 [Candida theae]|uniref:RRN6 beta-propeller domain-containing protein n=1 Tax=Candida theae TaxID=1198502 RepID=A0AAD5BF62_9ASCO|nr:uncharacterized protein KGF57_002498 [Candida theae]KAI5958653.1 hypothetical protein KGF57_002498 [Candida theae]